MIQLLRDTVALWLNTASLEAAITAARDMRSCTRTVVITPNFFLAHGPIGVRSLYELGITDVLLDMRLSGSPQEIWQCVTAAARHNVRAITVSALAGRTNIQYALNAAEASKQTTHPVKRPRIIVSTLPVGISDAAMIDELQMRVRRPGHIKEAVRQVVELGADGVILEYEDMKHARKISKTLPLLVYSQRRVRNYTEVDREDEKGMAGITELLKAGASHVIYDSEFVRRTNIEWAADMITKELASVKESRPPQKPTPPDISTVFPDIKA